MLRRSPCVMVAILFWVLAVAASAHAECAWVLWDQEWTNSEDASMLSRMMGTNKSKWALAATFQTKPECERAVRERVNRPWNRSKPGGPQIAFHCYPDTIDPRGAKGK